MKQYSSDRMVQRFETFAFLVAGKPRCVHILSALFFFFFGIKVMQSGNISRNKFLKPIFSPILDFFQK